MILKAENISKQYFRKTGQANYFYAVQPLSLTLEPGTVTVLLGRSGSGKTTLLHMLSGLLSPTSGNVWLDDTDLYALKDKARSRLRNEMIGVIPQGRSAVDSLTVLENILLPGLLGSRAVPLETALRWMDALGIRHLESARPAELSGGELRRAAIARALARDPAVLLADEPTGDLDDENTRLALSLLQAAARDEKKTVFLVTHETDALQYAHRAYRMDGGRISPLE